MEYPSERDRPWAQAILRCAYQAIDVKKAQHLLLDLASARLQRSLTTTNAAGSLISRTRHVKRNVKRWRGGKMMLRWIAAGALEAVKGLRRLKGHRDMPTLVAKLRARYRRLGVTAADEKVA